MSDHIFAVSPPVYILSYHPLVYSIIEKALSYCRVTSFSEEHIQHLKNSEQVLIVDTCSVDNWLAIAIRYGFMNRQPVIILTSKTGTQEEEFQMLHLGVRGIVPIARLESDLRAAVELVMAGHLWVRRNTLDRYIMQKGVSASSPCGFTPREEQIIPCLVEGFSNKEISQMLGISTRTVKFHVSNILRKIKVKSRRGIKAIKDPQRNPDANASARVEVA
jgi:DNA-binding NarL/FixJ family response regulator